MPKRKRKIGKYIKPTTEGKCPHCRQHVRSLEHHIHDMHLVIWRSRAR